MPHPHRPLLPLLVLACTAALPRPAAADCTLVFGQGRHVDAADTEAARQWDGINLAFNQRVAQVLGERGETALPLVARVAADDPATTVRAVIARAEDAGCVRIVETTVFADTEAGALVARLREYPLLQAADGRPRIGAPRHTVERQFDLSGATLERVRPAALGAQMAAELVEQRAARR
ncbi:MULTISPECIES: hypothetical protein [Rubrivivax]|uniref:hypothetical protein n=1 Tax=Rubrivivax TaxID=28067 RepID=UPI00020A49F1|nr:MULTISPECIES: hypothetical protein [Rubrivivax]EGJ12327.1 hypothetical protein RBXJA2T_18438 [Rubrivivax benzoatilyticus JA2 = ATCC BAA-35]MCC9598274.1 hypothetical protein [Rubrivivax sp. JA1055]MCC9645470.1 hypothetical protein [Rubrivivax sp. JA1029]MCD0417620.1 hypothetical protein [Rubrivivax sp. JA1024]